jgi:methyltransferase
MASLLILAAVFVPMLVEARRAALNERAQLMRGGREAPGDVYSLMRVAYPLAFLLMIGEGAWRGGSSQRMLLFGLALFVAAKLLKWWAIVTLGPAWTFRVITVSDDHLVRGGPYQLFRHPNYVGVFGELAGVSLMSGALVLGPLATIGFGLLMLKRISIEERALDALRPTAGRH